MSDSIVTKTSTRLAKVDESLSAINPERESNKPRFIMGSDEHNTTLALCLTLERLAEISAYVAELKERIAELESKGAKSKK